MGIYVALICKPARSVIWPTPMTCLIFALVKRVSRTQQDQRRSSACRTSMLAEVFVFSLFSTGTGLLSLLFLKGSCGRISQRVIKGFRCRESMDYLSEDALRAMADKCVYICVCGVCEGGG